MFRSIQRIRSNVSRFLIEDAALSSIVTHSSMKGGLPANAQNVVER